MIGGLLVDLISWRAAVGVGMLASPVAAFIWYDLPQRGDSDHRLDYAGAGSVLLMIGGLVFAVNRFPVDGATLLTGGAVVIAVVGGLLTASRSKRHPAPFIPMSVVSDRKFPPSGDRRLRGKRRISRYHHRPAFGPYPGPTR